MNLASSSGLACSGVRLVMQCAISLVALAVQSADVATDTEDLGCVGKADLGLVAGGCDPGCPLLGAPVAAVEGHVLGGEVAGRAGQHPSAGGQQGRLVPLDGQHVGGAPVGDQVPGALTLGMESIGRDDDARQVQISQ